MMVTAPPASAKVEVPTRNEPPMKVSARKTARRQEARTPQLALARDDPSYPFAATQIIAAFMFTCGVRAGTAGIVAAASGYLVLAQDRFAFINSLHVLFLGTFVLALTAAPLVRPSSSVRLLGLFLASIYLWAGLAKMQPEWLSGHALESQARAGAFAGPLGEWVEHAWFRGAVSIAIPLIELAVAGLLVADRRRPAIALALLFHLAVELTVKPDTLGLQMAVLLFAIWPVATGRVASR